MQNLSFAIKDWREEVELRIAAIIKVDAIGVTDGIAELPWEVACLDRPEKRKTVISKKILNKLSHVRTQVTKFLNEFPEPTLSQMLTELETKETVWFELDRTWSLEAKSLKALAEGGGEKKLQQLILRSLPTVSRAISLSEAAGAMANLEQSTLVKMLPTSQRKCLVATSTMLSSLERGVQPRGISGESNRPLTPIHVKKYRDTPPISMAYFCKCMPSLWQTVVYTPPICITIRLPFVSRYFCRSIRVRGRWDTPKYHRCDWSDGRHRCQVWDTSQKSGPNRCQPKSTYLTLQVQSSNAFIG